MTKFAVIVAGGSGARMASDIPKQFLLLKGRPILAYTINSFITAFNDISIILVLPAPHLEKGELMLKEMNLHGQVKIVAGGETRFHSVKNGLLWVTHPSIVFVHDGVRCLLSPSLIQKCFKQALEKGSAIPAVHATDTMRLVKGDSHTTIDREALRVIQTPQTFRSQMVVKAFEHPYSPAFTDEATVAEAAGFTVHLVEGEYTNLKITRPLDLCIAEKLLEERVNRT